MKKLVLLLLLLVIGAAAVGAWTMRDSGPEGLEVEVEPAGRREIVQTVTATGRVQPQTQVNLSADVSAKITRLEAAEGDWVEKGTLLVELDRERYVAAVESAEASLRVAQANASVAAENLEKARKDHERSRDLNTEGLETQARLDALNAAFEAERARQDAAQDQVLQVKAQLKQARHDLSRTRIHAPMSGTVSRLNKEVGEIALGSQFQEDVILVISNLAGMEVEVQVDENDIVSVSLGDEATIEVDALPELTLSGEVTEIANTATITGAGGSDQKTEFVVKIAVRDPVSQLRPGMTATADIVTEVRENAIGVPIQAVAVRTAEQLRTGPDDDRWSPDKDGFVELVFVVVGGSAEARAVVTGIQSGSHIEIEEGLNDGESVVIGNYRAISRDLKDGSQVTVKGEAETEPVG